MMLSRLGALVFVLLSCIASAEASCPVDQTFAAVLTLPADTYTAMARDVFDAEAWEVSALDVVSWAEETHTCSDGGEGMTDVWVDDAGVYVLRVRVAY